MVQQRDDLTEEEAKKIGIWCLAGTVAVALLCLWGVDFNFDPAKLEAGRHLLRDICYVGLMACGCALFTLICIQCFWHYKQKKLRQKRAAQAAGLLDEGTGKSSKKDDGLAPIEVSVMKGGKASGSKKKKK